MLLALGWIVVRASRDGYVDLLSGDHALPDESLQALDVLDEQIQAADHALFDELQQFLAPFDSLDLTWQFIPHLNNHSGILHFTSSRNHRGQPPVAIELLNWVASRGPGSYGLAYLHDDEDAGNDGLLRGRSGDDFANVFRVWRLRRGKVDELDDPFLSPIVPSVDPIRF